MTGRGAAASRPARVLLAVVAVAGALAAGAGSAEAAVPREGVLVAGTSLAGVRLGDTPAAVKRRWGTAYTRCGVCPATTWLFPVRGRRLAGAAVTFRGGRATAVFTLGAPVGWRSSRGLVVGDRADRIQQLHGRLSYRSCVGYGALTSRRGKVVTSFYTFGEAVYGFALTRAGDPVCQ